nr:MAG TPA: hypothetical protein [Caudoviricetes sp.]
MAWCRVEVRVLPPLLFPFKATFTHNFPSEPVTGAGGQGRARWFRISH